MLAAIFLVQALARLTDLTFVRHGETVANATGRYNSQTIDTFSAKGSAGVAALTKKLLAEPRFELILVSPSPRALRTIAPYLRASRGRALIWPLLYECCTQRRPKNAVATRFTFGEKIELPKDVAGQFLVEKDHDRYPVAPDYDAGLAQVAASVAEFKQRFAGRRVLVVGHSGQGGQLLHSLMGKWTKLDNALEVTVHLPTATPTKESAAP